MSQKLNYKIIKIDKAKIWSIEHLKNYLRVSHDYDDQLIYEMLDTAIEMAESITSTYIHKRVIELTIKEYVRPIHLKYLPMHNIEEALVIKTDEKQKLPQEELIINQEQGVVSFQEDHKESNIRITYIAGYGDKLPQLMQMGILVYLERLYERGVESNFIDIDINKYFMPFRKLKI